MVFGFYLFAFYKLQAVFKMGKFQTILSVLDSCTFWLKNSDDLATLGALHHDTNVSFTGAKLFVVSFTSLLTLLVCGTMAVP